MKSKLLIKNGIIISANQVVKSDLLIEDGLIKTIQYGLTDLDAEIIDAHEKYIIPGGFDPHVHLQLQTQAGFSGDDFHSGTRAAIAGGTTSIIDFVTPGRDEDWTKALDFRLQQASNSNIDYALHFSPVRWYESASEDLMKIRKNYGIASFKVYLAYQKTIGIRDDVLLKVMESVARIGGMVTIHCENNEMIEFLQNKFHSENKITPKYHALSRPAEVEAEAIYRVLKFAQITGCTVYIVHVSTDEGVELIRAAKKQGQKVWAETCSHYLLFDESVYDLPSDQSAAYVLSPVIKGKKDQDSLWAGILDQTISVIATDHCPFNLKGQKDQYLDNFIKMPNGAGGIEYRLALIYTYGVMKNRISLNQWVQLCCANPAQIFGLDQQKGDIQQGMDADLVIWDKNYRGTISASNQFQKCDHTIYEGLEICGKAEAVFLKGEKAFENGMILNENNRGAYLKR